MSKIDINQAPYYDDYDSSKQYTHLLAIPGRVAQAREITQIQSTMKDIIKGVGDSIMKDGDLVEGCQVVVNKFRKKTESITLNSNIDKVLLTSSTVDTILSVSQGDIQYTIGTSSSDGDCYLLKEENLCYIKWNGTTNFPAINSSYIVNYTYDADNTPKTVTVSPGKIYLQGIVLPVEETTIDITGAGEEIIGAKLIEVIVTEKEDRTLRDPAQGYDNYNQPGCHRIKSYVTITKDDSGSVPIATLHDGSLYTEKYAPNYSQLEELLAKRTYEESGSYIVEGLKVRAKSNPSDTTKFQVIVEKGTAYIKGYRVEFKGDSTLIVNKSTQYGDVTGIPFTFKTNTRSYRLSNKPYVKSITSVTGYLSVQKTASASADKTVGIKLADSDVVITEVFAGSTVYTQGVDYELRRDDNNGNARYFYWKSTGNSPDSGDSFTIKYRYFHTFTSSDYYLRHNTSIDGYDLVWRQSSGNKPVNNTTFIVDYTQYFARKDVVYLTKEGEIGYIEGIPAELGSETLPTAPTDTVTLAHISSPPNGYVSTNNSNRSISVDNVGLTRFTMSDIQYIVNRIRTIEYDQAINSLNNEARNYYDTNMTKRGIFTDPIIDLSKIDLDFNSDTNGAAVISGLPLYDVTLDLDSNTCYLPTITKTYDLETDTSKTTARSYEKVFTLGTTGESVVFSQMKATKSFLINPYSVYPNMPEVSLTPSTDTWFEDTYIEVPVSRTNRKVVSTSTRHISNTQRLSGNFDPYTTVTSSTRTTDTGVTVDTSVSDEVLSEETIRFIRSRQINVAASKFTSNLNNIKCYFDGVEIAMTPSSGYTSGTQSGSMKANSSGAFKATFTIPANTIPTGIKEVVFKTDDPGYASASALYHASGTARTIQRTVETVTTILQTRVTTVVTTTYIDPVGQTFVLDRLTLLSGIDLYFASKPSHAPVTCEIREVSNGNITSTVLGSKELNPNQVSTSSKGTVATRFEFTNPVYLEGNKEYAFVVRSTSDKYRIWIAELGEPDISTGNLVTSNPSLIGVMMSSSNNSSWTIHQTSDIKFRLIENTYNTSADVYFNNINRAFSRIVLLSDFANPTGTSITWSYSTDGGAHYVQIDPYTMKLLTEYKDNIRFKATLKRNSSTKVSPMLLKETNSTVLSRYDYYDTNPNNSSDRTPAERFYITHNVAGLDAYTKITVILDSYTPSGTSLKVYATTKDEINNSLSSASDMISLPNTDNKPLNYGWTEQTFTTTVSSSTNCRLYIGLKSDSSAKTPSFRRLRVIFS